MSEGEQKAAGGGGGGGVEEVPDPELDSLLDGEEHDVFLTSLSWNLG